MPALVSPSVSLLLILFATAPPPPDDDEIAQRPGLLATFTANTSRTGQQIPPVRKLMPTPVLDWGDGSPDPRIPSNGVTSRLEGFIIIRKPGAYRFLLRTSGNARVEVRVDGKLTNPEQDAILPFGMVSFRVDAFQTKPAQTVAIDWSGPGFAREPLPASVLSHDPKDEQPDAFEDGRRLADRLSCTSCHAILDMPRHASPGPPLPGLAADLDDAWLAEWLVSPSSKRPGTLMPSLGISRDDAIELVAFLKGQPRTKFPAEDELKLAVNVADASRGQLLFRSIGCLGCHPSPAKAPLETPPPAPRLDHLATAGDVLAVAGYLVSPPRTKLPSKHRPNLQLTSDESAHLARYLVGSDVHAVKREFKATARGRELFERYRCTSCHDFPKVPEPAATVALTQGSNARQGCLAENPHPPSLPKFDLTNAQWSALQLFVGSLPARPVHLPASVLADDTIRRKNCLGCHAREGEGRRWLGAQLSELLKDDPALGSLKGMLTPPDLTAVGDKLRPEYLLQTIQGAAVPARPWLTVRMPVFTFDKGEAERLAQSLVRRDFMPAGENASESSLKLDTAGEIKAGQLLGQKGFGCVNCHVIAGRIPPGGEAETLGPDLRLSHKRMTERYFKRWLADPQRIIEGTPMPRFVEPIRTVSNQTFDEQLASIWALLGTDRAERLASEGLKERLVRDGERALVVRDMVVDERFPGSPYRPRAIAIGLANGHSLLFDADRLSWTAGWKDGFLFRTKQGRLWEWHVEGKIGWIAEDQFAPVAFRSADGKTSEPVLIRERFGSFRELDFTKRGVKLVYTLRRANGQDIEVAETIEPRESGWSRLVEIDRVPEGLTPLVYLPWVKEAPVSMAMEPVAPGSHKYSIKLAQ